MDWMFLKPILTFLLNFAQARLGLNRDHDVAIFKKLDTIANEPRIDEILNDRIFTSNLRIEDDHVLQDLIDSLQRIENKYLDSTMQLRGEELAWEMEQLLSFVRQTFWSVPGKRLKFRPDPIAPQVYDAEWKELNEKLERAWEAYKKYRLAAKEMLKV